VARSKFLIAVLPPLKTPQNGLNADLEGDRGMFHFLNTHAQNSGFPNKKVRNLFQHLSINQWVEENRSFGTNVADTKRD